MPIATPENVAIFRNKILSWFRKNGRIFPWRTGKLSTYQLVIAEILLQRTKAETVAKFYTNFICQFPSWHSIEEANIETLEKTLQPIGLFKQRAKRLKLLATEMVKRQGIFPSARREIEAIPFMGQYIANAVQLFVFNKPMPLVDVNMSRVLERYFSERKLADIRYDIELQKLAHDVVNTTNPIELNWGILDFAALICKARQPLCENCFLNRECTYFQNHLLS